MEPVLAAIEDVAVRLGRIKAAIWANETESGVWFNVTLSVGLTLGEAHRSVLSRASTMTATLENVGQLWPRRPPALGEGRRLGPHVDTRPENRASFRRCRDPLRTFLGSPRILLRLFTLPFPSLSSLNPSGALETLESGALFLLGITHVDFHATSGRATEASSTNSAISVAAS